MAIKLKLLKLTDIDHVMRWVNNPEVVKNFQNFNKKITKKEELKFLKNLIKSKTDFVFSIFNGPEYIGQTAINQISWLNKLGRLSVFITPDHWGKGYAQKVIPMILKIAKQKRIHKIWLIYYSSNKKTQHLCKKLGFRVEGILKDEYYYRNQYHNMTRMAIILE